MDIEKALKEKVPFHARHYPWYALANGRKFEKWPMEESVPEIRRALKNDDEEKEFEEEFRAIEHFNGEVVDHWTYSMFIEAHEIDIRRNNWGIKNFKIFHIWNISLNEKKPTFLPWSAKFQSDENKIELEIRNYEKTENEISQTKVVHFNIDVQACDVPLFAIVDDCKIKYSLLSNAIRVKLEIRAYNDDGSPTLDVDGHIRAVIGFRGHYERYLFDGHVKCEKQERIAENTLMLSPCALIIPRDLGIFSLHVSLKDKDGNFKVEGNKTVWRRTVAVDERHYIPGEKGYIILTTIWSCLCVDSKHGICTCPGTAMGNFQAEQNDINAVEDTKDETVEYTYRPITTCNDDGNEGGVKRVKMRKPRQICSRTEEATAGDEDSK